MNHEKGQTINDKTYKLSGHNNCYYDNKKLT